MFKRCSNPGCNMALGKWRITPPKPYPEPRPEFCAKDPENKRACYDAYFAIPANKEKYDAYFPPPVPNAGTVLPLRPG